MTNFQQIIDAITAMDERLTESINDIKVQNITLINEFSSIKCKFDEISTNQNKIKEDLTAVAVQVEKLKQQSLSAEIVINGIPDKFLRKEIFTQTINKIFDMIDCTQINYWDYRSIFLMRKKSNATGFTPVCVQLCSSAQKNLLMKNQKLKGPILLQQLDTTLPSSDLRRIIIKDKMTQYNSDLMKESYIFKDKYNYKYLWFKDCVHIRKSDSSKITRIYASTDLNRLTEEEIQLTPVGNKNLMK